MFNLFSKPKDENNQPQYQEPLWDPRTVTVQQQPTSPSAPVKEGLVVEQPRSTEQMNLSLRGGGAGGICCGL
ncbi:hypothetical protein P168DRAFT_322763 [Aspergillus campestris IBT 28561]|uniref:Uncharacterized protein n=1 Tax=Aspergillus campestris (strain IBT 28561) TaxID=1392248 RepID=A0A2I1CQG3_ASPC2|nr:uncharacterized protein P168DRAFT_322763 [Aspergillus campestris IBT 28561]PKX99847.1 hypothetical protein P168DRAFT_322763 [Aspergillus campestris IBT 28561]